MLDFSCFFNISEKHVKILSFALHDVLKFYHFFDISLDLCCIFCFFTTYIMTYVVFLVFLQHRFYPLLYFHYFYTIIYCIVKPFCNLSKSLVLIKNLLFLILTSSTIPNDSSLFKYLLAVSRYIPNPSTKKSIFV